MSGIEQCLKTNSAIFYEGDKVYANCAILVYWFHTKYKSNNASFNIQRFIIHPKYKVR